MPREKPFVLQFPPDEIPRWAAAYCYKDDSKAAAAGAAAAGAGCYPMRALLTVVEWKAARALPLAVLNTPRAVEQVSARALQAADDAVALDALTELHGVGVPIASALLHFAAPGRYPILDYRAARSLGHARRTSYPTSYGVRYFAACRAERERHGVADLRTLDKALWAFDRHRHPPKRPHRKHNCQATVR